MKNENAILYNFKNSRIKRAAKAWAAQNGTSIQSMLTEAFEYKFPQFRSNKKIQ